MCKHEKHAGLKLLSLRLTSQNFPCKHAFTVDSYKCRTVCGEKLSPRTYFSNDQLKFKLFKKPYRTTTGLMIISESLYMSRIMKKG